MKIDKPGIYFGVSEADYRADPCPSPSLTQSLVKTLIERSPRHAWTECPRLNPQFEYDDDTKFDLGNVAHRLMLGRGKEIEVVQFADWRTKVAQEARETAADAGKIAVLQHQFEQAAEMVEAARRQLAKHEDNDAFADGAGEVMICWQEDGIWFRSLIDWLHTDLRTVDDYKTSGMSMAPHIIGMRAEAAGWHVQAAFIGRGLDILDPAGAGRRRYRFIGQETDKPHALTVMHMDEHWLTMGRKKVQAGVAFWGVSSKLGKWPSYPARAVVPEYPSFKEKQWLERELAGDFEAMNDKSLMFAG
ncbi:MAG TPA: PD-(D/E)XK nuclease-like domain-containing protein [Xanthobacteraceae bacterium]|jgi:hypothetical protein